jgi:hypothetical protein
MIYSFTYIGAVNDNACINEPKKKKKTLFLVEFMIFTRRLNLLNGLNWDKRSHFMRMLGAKYSKKYIICAKYL